MTGANSKGGAMVENESAGEKLVTTRAGRAGTPHVAVVVFPGSNCDHDLEHVCGTLFGCTVSSVWHRATALPAGTEIVFLPGGFAYGDYLRTGALAALSPVMEAVKQFAAKGGLVIGICNGFQVLCEAQLLPGALLPNASGTFCSRWVNLNVFPRQNSALFSVKHRMLPQQIRCPVAHGEGNYFATPEVLNRLESNGQVLFRYATGENPNGAARDIAGICNEAGNVIGLMPHPERACESLLGEQSGYPFFEALLSRKVAA